MKTPKNPNAFPLFSPHIDKNHLPSIESGMTLRDYFAAAALTGNLSGPTELTQPPKEWAKEAFLVADAMLAEREKEAQNE